MGAVSEIKGLSVFENRVLRRAFGHNRDKIRGLDRTA
jgi:hypothetical protein